MFLKIVNGNHVEIFDGFNRISARDLEANEPVVTSIDCIDFTDRPLSLQESTFSRTEIFLFKGNETVRQIIAFKPVYVLGDRGKTVERI
jgi:hypothetical protein